MIKFLALLLIKIFVLCILLWFTFALGYNYGFAKGEDSCFTKSFSIFEEIKK